VNLITIQRLFDQRTFYGIFSPDGTGIRGTYDDVAGTNEPTVRAWHATSSAGNWQVQPTAFPFASSTGSWALLSWGYVMKLKIFYDSNNNLQINLTTSGMPVTNPPLTFPNPIEQATNIVTKQTHYGWYLTFTRVFCSQQFSLHFDNTDINYNVHGSFTSGCGWDTPIAYTFPVEGTYSFLNLDF